MPRPPSLSLLADRCLSIRQLHQIHTQMLVTGRIPADAFAASRLLSFAALHPSGDHLPYALSLFSHTPSPNSFMYNTLIRAFSSSSTFPLQSLSLFLRMLRFGPKPGKHTFPFLLKSCSSSSLPITQQIHTHILKHGLHSDPYVINSLVLSYSSCGSLPDSRRTFDQSSQEQRNSTIWTTMISAYSQNSMSGEAIQLFHSMVRSGVEPCGATLASVLSACARTGELELGREIHTYYCIDKKNVGVILGTALVDMYAKNGAIAAARRVFDEMPEKNIATWNAMICGDPDGAVELFRELEKGRVRPNDVTFVGVLTACCHSGSVGLGRRMFRVMETEYGIEPKVEHYGCMVNLLARSGRLEEAEELVRGMKWKADVVVWGALLTACKNYGDIETAERVVEEILRLDPGNHGVYVILSNMYAGVGRWEDVERLRRVMVDGGLKKVPGWSCVDGHGESGRHMEECLRATR